LRVFNAAARRRGATTKPSRLRAPVENSTGSLRFSIAVIRFCALGMRAVAVRAFIAALLAATAGAHGRAESAPTLTVRLYNTSGVPAEELIAARRAAEAILGDTGVQIAFRLCGRATDPCDIPLRSSEVVVRILDAPTFNATLHPDAFGVTYIVKETNRGWLATVFADRIATAATRVTVEPGLLLGRVIAHEVGHLLLGIDYHGAAGVMRAEWPDGALDRDAGDWRFSIVEAQRMHHVLAAL
jgi:hypothetical protein